MIRRRLLLTGAATLPFQPARAALPIPPGDRLAFHIVRKGSTIGEHILTFEHAGNALTVLATVISTNRQGWAVADCGLKALGMDHGNPSLVDGGDVWLVKIEGDVAYVQMIGACGGCPASHATLKGGIEAVVREDVPEIRAVEQI